MAELSGRSGVPVATIKYYQREGMLPPGVATAATRASYDEGHVRRLRLIRALVEIADLPVASVKDVLSQVDDEVVGLHDMFGAVQYALGPSGAVPADEAASAEVDALISTLGWQITPEAPARRLLAGALSALHAAGAPAGPTLTEYAQALRALAELEVASVAAPADQGSRVEMAEAAVAGMVLYEPVLIALRRLAQEDASARRFGTPD